MNKKTPMGIILLGIFIAWGMINLILRILFAETSSDTIILNHYNIAWIGYVINTVSLIFGIMALYSIIAKKNWGVKVLYLFFAFNVFCMLLFTILSLLDFEFAKDTYIQSRINRGLSIENTKKIMNSATAIIMSILYVVFYSLLGRYIHKKRDYFSH